MTQACTIWIMTQLSMGIGADILMNLIRCTVSVVHGFLLETCCWTALWTVLPDIKMISDNNHGDILICALLISKLREVADGKQLSRVYHNYGILAYVLMSRQVAAV